MMQQLTAALSRDCPRYTDDLWLVDSTPVESTHSRKTVQRSDMAGYATSVWLCVTYTLVLGLRLHFVATPTGLNVACALISATTDERDSALAMLHLDPNLANRLGQVQIAGKGDRPATFALKLSAAGIALIRPSIRSGTRFSVCNNSHDCYVRSSNQSAKN